jgi:uncharacterized protein YegL
VSLTIDPTALARRQLQVVLLLDCSGSMRGDRIASLSYALLTALPDLKEAAAENPEVDVRVRVLAFGDAPRWLTAGAVPVDELVWPDLEASGHTALGSALSVTAATLTASSQEARQLPPILVLASDGYPTDDVEEGLRSLLATPEGAAATRIAIAIGGDAGIFILNRFINNPALPPLQASNAAELAQHIRWATTAPVKAASSPVDSDDPMAALARTRPLDAHPVSDIIW